MSEEPKPKRAGRMMRLNRSTFTKLVVVAAVMFGFGYAMVPLYRQICEELGLNVLTQKDGTVSMPANTQVDKTRSIVVELDANAQGPWRFRPTQNSVTVHPGELTTVTYEVVNTQGRTVAAQAIPSYAPQNAMPYFKKVECFCFKQQTLGPHEAKQMPVVFYVDQKLPKEVKNITLSYTFFEIGGVVAGKD